MRLGYLRFEARTVERARGRRNRGWNGFRRMRDPASGSDPRGRSMGFDRRREKSFGEPTRVRSDGTTGTARDEDLPKRPANTAYERYKQELHAFFNGDKPLPAHMKDMRA